MKAVRTVVIAAALIGLAGIASSQAQTNVSRLYEVTFKGKLSPSGATVANEDLSGNTNSIALMETGVGILIGEFSLPSANVTNVSAAYLLESSHVTTASSKSVNVLTGTPGPTSNAVLLVNLTGSGSGSTLSFKATVSGIWIDGTNAVSASIDSIKPKK